MIGLYGRTVIKRLAVTTVVFVSLWAALIAAVVYAHVIALVIVVMGLPLFWAFGRWCLPSPAELERLSSRQEAHRQLAREAGADTGNMEHDDD